MFSGLPPLPSELYLAGVLATKRPRGRPVKLATTPHGWQLWVDGANLVKCHRKARAMAYAEARQLQAVPASNGGQRQLAAAVLAGFMQVLPDNYGNPQRIVHSHADYTHALQFYRFNLLPRRPMWQRIP